MSDIPEGTSYVHPAEKQCNYSVNLSNYYTKTEIDEMISELEEAMPPSLVGTYDLGSISFNMDSPQPRNLSVTTCDYIEISLPGYSPNNTTILKGSSFEFYMSSMSSSGMRSLDLLVELNSGGTLVTFEIVSTQGDWDYTRYSLGGGSIKCYG